MGDLSREQEQAIARSTMYLVAALLSIVMICIAGLFLSAELKEQALQKAETAQQIELQQEITPQAQRPWTLWRRYVSEEARALYSCWRLRSRRLSRHMAQQASLKGQSATQALAVLSQPNHVPQIRSQLSCQVLLQRFQVPLPLP